MTVDATKSPQTFTDVRHISRMRSPPTGKQSGDSSGAPRKPLRSNVIFVGRFGTFKVPSRLISFTRRGVRFARHHQAPVDPTLRMDAFISYFALARACPPTHEILAELVTTSCPEFTLDLSRHFGTSQTSLIKRIDPAKIQAPARHRHPPRRRTDVRPW